MHKKTLLFSALFSLMFSQVFADISIEFPNEIIAQSNNSQTFSINDHDEVLLRYNVEGLTHHGVWSPYKPPEVIENKSGYPLNKIGNNGVILSGGNNVFIWSKLLGNQEIDIKKDISDVFRNSISLTSINSFGQIIGKYETNSRSHKAFIWSHGVAKDFVLNDAEALGFHIVNIDLISINDNGAVTGIFEHGEKHPLKDRWIIKGKKYFFWDGSTHILDTNDAVINSVYLNNKNEVLIQSELIDEINDYYTPLTYLWTKNEGTTFITDKINARGFNDKNQIIGNAHQGNDCVLLNKQGHLINLSNAVKELNPGVRLFNTPEINNNGVVLVPAEIWGESHFLLIYTD